MTGYFNFLASAAAEAAEKDHPMAVVAGLGMGTVFVGLISLVLILMIMNLIFSKIKPKENIVPDVQPAAVADEKMDEETVAAVSAAIAETLGREVTGIRITSIKKVK